MGCNYYILEPNKDYDSNCPIKSKTEPKYVKTHLGKSSAGWTFGVHVYPERDINTLDDWIAIFQELSIKDELYILDEYGYNLSLVQFLDTVRERSSNSNWGELKKNINKNPMYISYLSLEHFLEVNQAIKGPNNLLRRRIDKSHCISHGSGTWDHVIGDFS